MHDMKAEEETLAETWEIPWKVLQLEQTDILLPSEREVLTNELDIKTHYDYTYNLLRDSVLIYQASI